MRSFLPWCLSAAFVTTAGGLVGRAAFTAGPPPARTGGFGEPTCHECHASEALNDSAGRVTLSALPPAGYDVRQTYQLEVVLLRPGMARGGFELSARVDAPGGRDRQAGTLEPVDDRTQLAKPAGPVQYLEHTSAGTDLAARDTIRWRFRWVPPPVGAPVVFHIAANAANDDNSPFGDFIYTTEIHLLPAR